MKEHKFRAWNKKLKQMFYSDDCFFVFQNGKLIERDGGGNIEDDIIMEYIGHKDKNDKEIYEEDIVRCTYYPLSGDTFTGVVKFIHGSFYIEDKEGYKNFNWEDYVCEVIGNVYENPELLESVLMCNESTVDELMEIRKALWDLYKKMERFDIIKREDEIGCELLYSTYWDCQKFQEFVIPRGIKIYKNHLDSYFFYYGKTDSHPNPYLWYSPNPFRKALEVIKKWKSSLESEAQKCLT